MHVHVHTGSSRTLLAWPRFGRYISSAAQLALEVEHHRGVRSQLAARLGFLVRREPMDLSFIDRIDATGTSSTVPESGIDDALRQGEAFHRELRTHLKSDYVA